jgi:hypothetical protein
MRRNIDNRNISLFIKEFLEWGLWEEISLDLHNFKLSFRRI